MFHQLNHTCVSFAVHYGLAALHAVFGDQSGRPWSFEESTLIQA